ncbi:MAG: hypothetical protein H7833_00390 [Magnetococcus sp. DMHC-1]
MPTRDIPRAIQSCKQTMEIKMPEYNDGLLSEYRDRSGYSIHLYHESVDYDDSTFIEEHYDDDGEKYCDRCGCISKRAVIQYLTIHFQEAACGPHNQDVRTVLCEFCRKYVYSNHIGDHDDFLENTLREIEEMSPEKLGELRRQIFDKPDVHVLLEFCRKFPAIADELHLMPITMKELVKGNFIL